MKQMSRTWAITLSETVMFLIILAIIWVDEFPLLGCLLYLVLIKNTSGRASASPSATGSAALHHIWLPLILTTIAIFTDDAIDQAGLKVYFWWDEFTCNPTFIKIPGMTR
jgi:hypothetical protein